MAGLASVRRCYSQAGSALKISEQIECEIFEPPRGFGSRQSNSSGHLSAHQHCHASKDVLDACSDCGLNAIKLFSCFTKGDCCELPFRESSFRICRGLTDPQIIRLNMPNQPRHSPCSFAGSNRRRSIWLLWRLEGVMAYRRMKPWSTSMQMIFLISVIVDAILFDPASV